jgi:hypothetical protein
MNETVDTKKVVVAVVAIAATYTVALIGARVITNKIINWAASV